MSAIGLDFGTTNCALAWASPDAPPRLVDFASTDGPVSTFRSVLYFDRGEEGDGPVGPFAGPRAIERYLTSEEKGGRLVQSLKSFLASRLFQSTQIFGRSWRLEGLIGALLRELREEAEAALGTPVDRAVVGRPVRFVNSDEDTEEALALTRLRAALGNAGFREVDFEFEPVGAAYHYENDLERDELILIADLGGGTSDFSLLHVGPTHRKAQRRAESLLGNAGVPVAGDAFDGKLVRNLVAPRLGRGTEVRSFFDRILPIPAWIYHHLERWHHLSFLKSPRTLQLIYELRREALEPERIDALLHVVDRDLGFLLFRAVEQAKRALSSGEHTVLHFEHEDLVIDAPVSRGEFECWIAEETAAIAACVDALLLRCHVAPSQLDRVFLTGGSSFVPAVRRLFEERFGEERLRSGGELTSVASGLALRALETS